ncbi:MAG: hypothetical protein JWM13_2796 [Arthrobacter sp.]|nr:hypothetical protein [Arthrobacter sp.]
MVVDELREHYKAVAQGEPVYHDLHTRAGASIGVFEWPKATNRLGVHFYASAGASNHGPGARRHAVEVFLGVKHGDAAVLEGFANMAISVLIGGGVPQHGSFISGNWKVIKGRNFTGWVLTERPDDLVPELQLQDGRHVVFLDALPVFPEEAEYRNGNRSEELFETWEEAGVKSWDLDRALPPGIPPRPSGLGSWLRKAQGRPQTRR